MLKILAFGDLLGNTKNTKKLLSLPLENFDAIAFLGDIPDPQMFKDLRMKKVLSGETNLSALMEGTKPPEGLRRALKEVGENAKVFKLINQRKNLFSILGNADLMYYTQKIDLTKSTKLLHKRTIGIGEYTIVGFNGRPSYIFESSNPDEQVFSEKQIYDELAPILDKTDSNFTVLLTHCPPHGILDQVNILHREYAIKTYGDKAKDGHIGSLGLRKLVDKFKPAIHLFGHIHEAKGTYVSGKSIFINVGSLGESHEYVILTKQNNQTEVTFNSLASH